VEGVERLWVEGVLLVECVELWVSEGGGLFVCVGGGCGGGGGGGGMGSISAADHVCVGC